jgi:glucuronate isomerase
LPWFARDATHGNPLLRIPLARNDADLASLEMHPDRLLPADPATRGVARELYAEVRDLPIISPHGHVPPRWLAEDVPFSDPTSLLITPDHYVTRMLHGQGVPLSELGVGREALTPQESRAAFRILCDHWSVYRGTPVKYWMESQLVEIFGVDLVPSAQTADAIYDTIAAALATPEFRPRALYERFGIGFLATTDDPADDLRHHQALAADPSWTGTVAPTFRPDKYLEAGKPDWKAHVDLLGEVARVDTSTYEGWVAAMENRRAYFKANGAVSTDHSHRDARMEPLAISEARRLYAQARAGRLGPAEADTLRRHFMFEQARMAADDGLVMTLHPAVHRNHHTPTFEAFGADVGGDIPVAVEFADALQPVLAAFGAAKDFHLIAFTMDETVYARELAPLAGFYPGFYVGAPWWFIDAPNAMTRFRAAVTEAAGFTKTSGFIDDTRAFLSIPARHDTASRMDSGYLAGLVVDHRLTLDEARELAVDLVAGNPRRAFKLP